MTKCKSLFVILTIKVNGILPKKNMLNRFASLTLIVVKKKMKRQNSTEVNNVSHRLLELVINDAIYNDVEIRVLQKSLSDLVQRQPLKYLLKTNGEIEVVHTEGYNRQFAEIVERIEHRQMQIISAYIKA